MHSDEPRSSKRTSPRRLSPWLFSLLLLVPLAYAASVSPSSALSEIKREDLPAPPATPDGGVAPPVTVPDPDPIDPGASDTEEPVEGESDLARPNIEPDGPLPEIIYNLDRLPEPVRRMHDKLLEAAKTGDVENLRPLIGTGDDATQLSFGGVDGDPIAFIKGLSGDPDGHEILAIMEEVLNAGFVHLDAGTAEELYVWPYFFAVPLERLDPRQKVELFKIVTAGDYEDMKAFGTYIFYRMGIDPDGRWLFFVAGD